MDLPSCPGCGAVDLSTDADLTRPVFARLHDQELTVYTNSYRPEARRLQPVGYIFCTQCRQRMLPTPTANPHEVAARFSRGLRDGHLKDPPGWGWPVRSELDDPQPDAYHGLWEWFHDWYDPKK